MLRGGSSRGWITLDSVRLRWHKRNCSIALLLIPVATSHVSRRPKNGHNTIWRQACDQTWLLSFPSAWLFLSGRIPRLYTFFFFLFLDQRCLFSFSTNFVLGLGGWDGEDGLRSGFQRREGRRDKDKKQSGPWVGFPKAYTCQWPYRLVQDLIPLFSICLLFFLFHLFFETYQAEVDSCTRLSNRSMGLFHDG